MAASPSSRGLLMTVSIALFLSVILNMYNLQKLRARAPPSPVPSVANELPLTVNPALLNFLFAQHYDISNDSEWATMIPANSGRVRLPTSSGDSEFEVALYKDLHCLDVIRSVFVSMYHGSSEQSPEAEECLQTIRQAILCTADITLEPAYLVCHDGEACNDVAAEATGNDVNHSCRDWVQVREFVESNQEGWTN